MDEILFYLISSILFLAIIKESMDIFFIKRVIKLFEGLPKFMRVSREGLALLECQFLRVWFEGQS